MRAITVAGIFQKRFSAVELRSVESEGKILEKYPDNEKASVTH